MQEEEKGRTVGLAGGDVSGRDVARAVVPGGEGSSKTAIEGKGDQYREGKQMGRKENIRSETTVDGALNVGGDARVGGSHSKSTPDGRGGSGDVKSGVTLDGRGGTGRAGREEGGDDGHDGGSGEGSVVRLGSGLDVVDEL